MSNDSLIEAARLLRAATEVLSAGLKVNTYEPPQEVRVIRIELDTAQTIQQATARVDVGFPFKSYYVSDATDSSTQVKLYTNTRDSNQDGVSIRKKDSHNFEQQQAKAFLSWDAQAGKFIEITFFVSSSFQSGTQVSEVSSTVDGNSITEFAPVTISSTAAALIDASTRNVINLVNEGPDDCYIGGSGVSAVSGSERGLLLAVGAERVYSNTAAIYGASLGSSVIRFQTEA